MEVRPCSNDHHDHDHDGDGDGGDDLDDTGFAS